MCGAGRPAGRLGANTRRRRGPWALCLHTAPPPEGRSEHSTHSSPRIEVGAPRARPPGLRGDPKHPTPTRLHSRGHPSGMRPFYRAVAGASPLKHGSLGSLLSSAALRVSEWPLSGISGGAPLFAKSTARVNIGAGDGATHHPWNSHCRGQPRDLGLTSGRGPACLQPACLARPQGPQAGSSPRALLITLSAPRLLSDNGASPFPGGQCRGSGRPRLELPRATVHSSGATSTLPVLSPPKPCSGCPRRAHVPWGGGGGGE